MSVTTKGAIVHCTYIQDNTTWYQRLYNRVIDSLPERYAGLKVNASVVLKEEYTRDGVPLTVEEIAAHKKEREERAERLLKSPLASFMKTPPISANCVTRTFSASVQPKCYPLIKEASEKSAPSVSKKSGGFSL